MAKLFKNRKSDRKKVILANDNSHILDAWNGKTLVDLDDEINMVNVMVGTQTVEVNGVETEITNLIVETDKQFIKVSLSKEASQKLEDDEEYITDNIEDMVFRTQRVKGENDKEGDYDNYTGPRKISFGKPSGLTLGTTKVLIGTEKQLVEDKK